MARLLLSIMGAFAEFERALIKERQKEGIALAKKKGIYRGRKPVLSSSQIYELKQKVAGGFKKIDLANQMGISRYTLYKYLKKGQ
jgi:DNA invertase Pin-like site-specific DNA recombinase